MEVSRNPVLEASGPVPPPVLPDIELVHSEHRQGYGCSLIVFSTAAGERINAYLLVPDDVPETGAPAILMLHDHGARFDIGKEKLVRPAEIADSTVIRSSAQWVEKYFDGVYFADRMAAEGYVVMVADALYWGDRSSTLAKEWAELCFGNAAGQGGRPADVKLAGKLKQEVFDGQRHVYDSLAAAGEIWAGKILHDDMSALSLLKSLPCVDGERTGAFGFSMGAHRCWLLSAASPGVRSFAAVDWMTLKSAYDSTSVSDLSMRLPQLRESMDFPDMASLAFPVSALFVGGREDRLFPSDAVEAAFRKLRAAFDAEKGHGCILETVMAGGGHHCGTEVQDMVSDFFKRTL